MIWEKYLIEKVNTQCERWYATHKGIDHRVNIRIHKSFFESFNYHNYIIIIIIIIVVIEYSMKCLRIPFIDQNRKLVNKRGSFYAGKILLLLLFLILFQIEYIFTKYKF